MKKINNKWVIVPFILLVTIGIVLFLILFVFKNNHDHDYVAYVDINPLIKLNFKVSCDRDNNCSSPIITDYELINEDAKTIYKDLVIKDKTLKETIELLTNAVKDNDIMFKEIHIYSNYDKKEEFKVESTEYNIIFDTKTDKDLEQFIDELVVKKENTITKEVLVPLTFNMVEVGDKMLKVDNYEFLEQQDKIVIKTYECHYVDGYEPSLEKLPEFKFSADGSCKNSYFPITIEGPKEKIDTIPDEITSLKGDIIGMIDITGLNEGTHETEMKFISKIPEIIIQAQPIKVRLKLKLGNKSYSSIQDDGNLKAHCDINHYKEILNKGEINQETYDELIKHCENAS